MFATYGPSVPAHPTRCGVVRGTAGIRLIVVHTSEGGELATSAESLARFIASPRTATNVASYHYIADTDRVIPSVPDECVAYANAGANHDGLSICYPGRAAQTVDEWHDANTDPMHDQVSRWLADKSAAYGVPLRRLTTAQVRAGERGVCGHNEVSKAFGRSTHTDPGTSYPWSYVLGRAAALLVPPKQIPGGDDDMPKALLIKGATSPSYYAWNGVAIAGVGGLEAVEAAFRAGLIQNTDPVVLPQAQVDAMLATE